MQNISQPQTTKINHASNLKDAYDDFFKCIF